MNVDQAYDQWASQYDSNENKTRDLEAKALRDVLTPVQFDRCLEIGCGTGKNTSWLKTRCGYIMAVDFSQAMLQKAKEKNPESWIEYVSADINQEWTFVKTGFDLVIFSLVLEHIENLDIIFSKTAAALTLTGKVYIGELHPFKQYLGSKARFETENGTETVTCFTHHLSHFFSAAKEHGFVIESFQEYFDEEGGPPRIASMLFRGA